MNRHGTTVKLRAADWPFVKIKETRYLDDGDGLDHILVCGHVVHREKRYADESYKRVRCAKCATGFTRQELEAQERERERELAELEAARAERQRLIELGQLSLIND
ncbi:MAG: hypothetical protein LC754_10425 [Acidobacteria bacterium]|nr:hypothetical protein [Acidobacteriota bacterium]